MFRILSLLATAFVLMSFQHAYAQSSLDQALRPYLDESGQLTEEGRRRLNADLQKTRKQPTSVVANEKQRSTKQKYDASRPPKKEEQQQNGMHGVLLLRDAYTYAAFLHGGELNNAGASFSYTNDKLDDARIFSGKGALMYAWYGDVNRHYVGPVDAVRLQRFAFIPGVQWDFNSKNGKHKGTVAARGGLELEYIGLIADIEYFTTKLAYTTDIATNETKIYDVEYIWQPLQVDKGIGVKRRVLRDGNLLIGLYPTVSMNHIYVGEAGNFANLMKGESFLWFGPNLNAEASFSKGSTFERFSFSAEYSYWVDMFDNARRPSLDWWKVSANFKLVEQKKEDPTSLVDLTLTTSYTQGTQYRTLESADEFYVGLKLKLNKLPAPAPEAGDN